MKRTLALSAVVILGACSGGGGSAVPGTTSAGAGTGTVLAIKIPHVSSASSAARRSPAFLSAATQSVAITVYPYGSATPLAGYPIADNLTPTSPGCVAGQNATVCSITLALAPNTYDISLTTYDQINGGGNALSAAQSVVATVVEGTANSIGITLGGIPASIQLIGSGPIGVKQEHVVTLPSNASGTMTAYALDADGDEILGAGAPAITVTTDNAARIAVTPPTAGQPNAIGLASLATNAIAHVTVTATPAAGTGSTVSTISRWVTVEDPAMALVYIGSGAGVNVFDQTATEVTPSGTPFAGVASGEGTVGMTYDSANGLIYVAVQGTIAPTYTIPSYIAAFDKSGNPVPLAAGATGLNTLEGIAYDPAAGYIYASDNNVGIDPSGNLHLLAQTLLPSYAMTYDSVDNVIFDGPSMYNAGGSLVGSLAFPSSGTIQAETYNVANGLLYVATAAPTGVEVWNTAGVRQTTTGSFAVAGGASIGAIGADPSTGNVYVATNTRVTYGFDRQGNPLPAPWHTIPNAGAGNDAGGVLLITP
jgi:hypothetical protein